MRWITATNLETWAEATTARAELPALITELLVASAREIHTMRFVPRDKSEIHGFDGHLVAVDVPYVGGGESFWEFGTAKDYVKKANEDVKERSENENTTKEMRENSTLVVVTLRTWDQAASSKNELQKWRERKRQEFGWKAVAVIDGVMLAQWLEQEPAVAARWARRLGLAPQRGARSTDEFWSDYTSRFEMVLNEAVLLARGNADVEPAKAILNHLRSGVSAGALVLRADSPDEAIAFVVATIRKADDDVRRFLEAKTIVLDTDEAALEFADRHDLIFIPRGSVKINDRLARSGPTLIAIGRERPEKATYLSLQPPTTEAFANALQSMGIPEEKARLLARGCGRSVTILTRTFANSSAKPPEWAIGEGATNLIPALLAGAWDATSEEDKKIVCRLAGEEPYEKYEAPLRRFVMMDDPPIEREQSVWKLRAPVDAFVYLAVLLGAEHFVRLKDCVSKVFSELDSSLDNEKPPGLLDRPKPKHSSWLRDGLATTLLLIGVYHEATDLNIPGTSPQIYVDDLVSALPGLQTDWRVLASLRDELPLLAEAAPRPFLEAVENLLRNDVGAIRPIFREGDFFSPFSPHVFLLWALEVLAWDPEYLPRVSLILAKLTRLDPGGSANRPMNTLAQIFLLWHPNTNASQAMRLSVIDLIIREIPEVGWQLITKLLPTPHSIGEFTPRPQYRREAAGSDREQLTMAMVIDAYTWIVEKALELSNSDRERWIFLVPTIPNFRPELRARAYDRIDRFLDNASQIDREAVWAKLRDEVNRHIAFKDAQWALPADELDKLVGLVERFAPTDLISRHSWLFDNPFPDTVGKADNPERAAAEGREKALTDLVNVSGRSAILTLASSVKMPQLVASAVRPLAIDVGVYNELLNSSLDRNTEKLDQFAAAISSEALDKFPEEWPQAIRDCIGTRGLAGDRLLKLFTYWPDDRFTWTFVARIGPEVDQAYWQKKNVWPIRGDESDLSYAAERYIDAKRAVAAIHALGKKAGTLPFELISRLVNIAIEELMANPQLADSMLTYHLWEILDALESRGAASVSQIAQIEYKLFPLFEYDPRRQLRLHRLMAEDPEFYVQLLLDVFRGENEEPNAEEPTNEQRARARIGYQLLSSFHTLPGMGSDGIDRGRLESWIAEVRRIGEESNRKTMTHEFIGHVLAHSPVDPQDQAWPHHVVRDLIESMASEEMDAGISVGRFNMRGVHGKAMFEGGRQERGFAVEYRDWAGKCAAWPRTQKLLREIADSWDRDASREDTRARLDRMRS